MTMTDLKKTTVADEEQSISATARLPGLEIDLWHRRLPGESGEELTIRLRAVPSTDRTPCLQLTRGGWVRWLNWA